ncbi:hypothetical protein KAJ89_00790 [Candidatus Parcubacteria bacterium]|nr:hypothetical protein [Candidatus Parcubacteria bacterium]
MKNYKKILILLIILSLISIIIGYVARPHKIELCQDGYWACMTNYPDTSWGKPLFNTPIFPLLVFVILFFTPANFFRAWRWFALVFGLISILLIVLTPAVSHDFFSQGPKSGFPGQQAYCLPSSVSLLFFSRHINISEIRKRRNKKKLDSSQQKSPLN